MTMRFGLLGSGYWARVAHGAGLVAHPDADLVGVWGRDPGRTREAADELDTRPYDNLDALLDEVDAVAVALPPDVQAELAVRAAEHGCHLLLDKPLAFTVATADRLVEAVERAGVRSIVFFTNRFQPEVAGWLAAAAGGALPEVAGGVAAGAPSTPGVPGGPAGESVGGAAGVPADAATNGPAWPGGRVRLHGNIYEPGNPFGASPWRRQWGALWDIGPHALSILLPVLGPVDRVVAERGPGDSVEVLTHHVSGATGSMSLSLTAPAGDRAGEWILYGAAGRTTMPEAVGTPLDAFGECVTQLLAGAPVADSSAVGSSGWRHPCDVHFGRDVVAVLAATQDLLDQPAGQRSTPVAWRG